MFQPLTYNISKSRWDGMTDDQREFEALYHRSSRRAYNLAYRLLGNSTEAEDITQDAFVRAWRHFEQYDRARPFEGWLFRIVTNLVVDRRRRQKRVPMYSLDAAIERDTEGSPLTIDIPDVSADPAALLIENELSEPLQNALDALPQDYRVAVLLADVEDRSYEEIAEIMHCPIGTVRSRIHRARQMLRKRLEKSAGMWGH
jgi:RNA polymerase sigma-70 factor (ECF subfamily)